MEVTDASTDVYLKILECVDSALGKLGESVKESIYYHLKRDFMLGKSKIPREPEVFEKALTSIFGKEGYKVIEKMILTEIRKKFQVENGLDLIEAVKVLKNPKPLKMH